MKKLVEIMYLTEVPIILSGEKYKGEIRPIPATSYREGIMKMLNWMKEQNVQVKRISESIRQ